MAGVTGSVTVATNMAGRGTDIVLGGNPEHMADLDLREQGLSPAETPEEYEAAWAEALEAAQKRTEEDHEEVVDAGGLYVLGTERHESRRIDNQLRGRAGRQGDPGESRFYLSLGDDLMLRANGAAIETMMDRLKTPEDVPIESKIVSRAIQSAQTQVEQQNFEIRKKVLKYDEVLNRQREVIYAERHKVLNGEDLARAGTAHARRCRRGVCHRCHRDRLCRGVGSRPALDRTRPALPGGGDPGGVGRKGRWERLDLTAKFLTDELDRRHPGRLRPA